MWLGQGPLSYTLYLTSDFPIEQGSGDDGVLMVSLVVFPRKRLLATFTRKNKVFRGRDLPRPLPLVKGPLNPNKH